MQYIIFTLLLIITSPLLAETEKNCEYKKDFVAHKQITDKNVGSYHWSERISSESDEQITTLYLTYKSGDMAIIEHKYCSMYNFEVSYLVANPEFSNSQKNISQLMANLFKQYAIKKITFTPPLENILKNKNYDFDFSGYENVELFIEQQPLTKGSIFSHIITFYVGIGGMA